MILPLAQDMLTMSAQSLGERYLQNYEYIKAIVQEKWRHIEIQELDLKGDVKGLRTIVGNSDIYWIITINNLLSEEEKYIALMHELLHCTIDEIRILERNDDEKVIKYIEKSLE